MHLYLIGIKQIIMRKILRYIIPALLFICLLNACEKSFNEQQSVPITPETPDLSVEIKQNVTGYISNENGAPVANAIVTAGSKSTTTDQQGHFVINDVTPVSENTTAKTCP